MALIFQKMGECLFFTDLVRHIKSINRALLVRKVVNLISQPREPREKSKLNGVMN